MLRSAATKRTWASVGRTLDGHVVSALRRCAEEWLCSDTDLLFACALVAIADFSGTREVSVAIYEGNSVKGWPISLNLQEGDTLHGIALQIKQQRGTPGSVSSQDLANFPCFVAFEAAPGRWATDAREIGAVFREHALVISYAADLYEPETAGQLADYVLTTLGALSGRADEGAAEVLRPSLDEALGWLC